jgi:hypothetical protein
MLVAAYVLAAKRLHGDDTPVPVQARGKTITGRLWVYVRDDRPFCGRHRERSFITHPIEVGNTRAGI